MQSLSDNKVIAVGTNQVTPEYFVKGSFIAPEGVIEPIVKSTAPPVFSSVLPAEGYSSATTPISVTGIVASGDPGLAGLKINGTTVAVSATNTFTKSVALTTGANVITLVATDLNGVTKTLVLNVTKTV